MSSKKIIISNIFSLGSIEIIGLLIPIISMPLLTSALGADMYGQYLLIMTILAFGNTIVDYGVQYSGVRDVSKNINNKKTRDFLFSNYQAIRLFLSFIYIFIISFYFVLFKNEFVIYILSSLVPYIFGYFLSSPWFFLSINKTKILLISTFSTKIITLIYIVFFLKDPEDFLILLYFTSYPSLIAGIILSFYLIRIYHVKVIRPKYFISYIKRGWNIFVGILAPNFYNSIPVIILGSYGSSLQFAKFAIASRICSIIMTFQDVFAKAIYPVIIQNSGNHLKSIFFINITFSSLSIFFIFTLGEFFLKYLIGSELAINNLYLYIISFGIFFNGVTNALSKGYFLPNSYDLIYKKISMRVSILSAILSYILIYKFGVLGGAIAITVARFLFSLDYSVTYIKMKKNTI
ncbi:oligosaccharide flippase family protein [Providencia vermicola]|uniref:oligosaccharide flippase family protein n=1 Tax=Providencia TaxID=586 RepID=UPI0018C77C75|nr:MULTISPECIES: oligosaccharide flippase family protein [Providencia]MBG5921222.1 oligosaccharide flippase family protein [Providencia stuartii]